MFKKIRNAALGLIMALGLVFTFTQTHTVYAQNNGIADNICTGVLSASGEDASDASSCEEDGENSFSTIITRVINIFSILIGSISVIMIIIGGFRYIISGGDQNSVTAAKNTIMYAIIGLVVVLFSQVIVRFVLTNAISKN